MCRKISILTPKRRKVVKKADSLGRFEAFKNTQTASKGNKTICKTLFFEKIDLVCQRKVIHRSLFNKNNYTSFEIGPNRFCLNDKNCQDLYDRKTNTVIECVPINK